MSQIAIAIKARCKYVAFIHVDTIYFESRSHYSWVPCLVTAHYTVPERLPAHVPGTCRCSRSHFTTRSRHLTTRTAATLPPKPPEAPPSRRPTAPANHRAERRPTAGLHRPADPPLQPITAPNAVRPRGSRDRVVSSLLCWLRRRPWATADLGWRGSRGGLRPSRPALIDLAGEAAAANLRMHRRAPIKPRS